MQQVDHLAADESSWLDFPSKVLTPAMAMEPRFCAGDVVFYQAGNRARVAIQPNSVYLVNHSGQLLVRYVRMSVNRLYLATDETLRDPIRWDYVSLANQHILEVVRGRIVWICRKVEEVETGALETPRGYHRRTG